MKKKPSVKSRRVWVGYSDGQPHVYTADRRVRVLAVYPSRRAARAEYEDVRPMELRPMPREER